MTHLCAYVCLMPYVCIYICLMIYVCIYACVYICVLPYVKITRVKPVLTVSPENVLIHIDNEE